MFGWSQKEKDGALLELFLGDTYSEIDTKAVKSLLERKANPNLTDTGGVPLICKAARRRYHEKNSSEAITLLLAAGAVISNTPPYQPIHDAVEEWNTEAARTLINAGVDIYAKDAAGKAPLLKAVQKSKPDSVLLLIERGALDDPDKSQNVEVFCKVADWNLSFVDCMKIFEKIEDVNAATSDGDRPLHAVVRSDKHGNKMLNVLLAHKHIDIDAGITQGNTALLMVLKKGDASKAQRLLEAGASFAFGGKDGRSPLYYAAKMGSIPLVTTIIEADRKQGGGSLAGFVDDALQVACAGGYSRVAERLIEAGANPNCVGRESGYTPLINAAKGNHVETLGMLIKAGADIGALDNGKMSAYDHAVTSGASQAKIFLQDFRKEPVAIVKAFKSECDFVKLGDQVVEAKQGGGLSLVFNFWMQQVIYRDTTNNLPLAVRNFDDIQRQEAIEEACQKLKDLGGHPPEVRGLGKTTAGLK